MGLMLRTAAESRSFKAAAVCFAHVFSRSMSSRIIVLSRCCSGSLIYSVVSAKNPVVIRFLTGESEPVLRPDEGRIGRDRNRQNRARQFFPEFRFYGEILAEVVGGAAGLDRRNCDSLCSWKPLYQKNILFIISILKT